MTTTDVSDSAESEEISDSPDAGDGEPEDKGTVDTSVEEKISSDSQ